MATDALRMLADAIDMRTRLLANNTVIASPAAAAETIIANVQPSGLATIESGVLLWADVAYTVGTNGTAVIFRWRQSAVGGTLVKSSGALTGGIAAANLLDQSFFAFDTAFLTPVTLYVLTMQVTNGSAASTVSALTVAALTL